MRGRYRGVVIWNVALFNFGLWSWRSGWHGQAMVMWVTMSVIILGVLYDLAKNMRI
jgi:cell division protein FtsX